MDVEPVGSGLGESEGKDGSVLAELGGREGDGSVVGQEVRVEEDARLARQRVLNVDDAKIGNYSNKNLINTNL